MFDLLQNFLLRYTKLEGFYLISALFIIILLDMKVLNSTHYPNSKLQNISIFLLTIRRMFSLMPLNLIFLHVEWAKVRCKYACHGFR